MAFEAKDWGILKAIPEFAKCWYRENSELLPTHHDPTTHEYRSFFSCDRDRVMYSSAFRRLSSKTQVFSSATSDELRTRLTHTLEVSQIARTISQQLNLDTDLTEAIALAHDLGHTPFGHVGERTINQFSQGLDKKSTNEWIKDISKGFKHNLQSLRVLIDYSENVKFTNYMLYGVREHSKRYWNEPTDVKFYDIYDCYCSLSEGGSAWSFEAFVVGWADEIAQRHHDIEDAYLQRIIPAKDILDKIKPLNKICRDSHVNKKFELLENEVSKLDRKSSCSTLSFVHKLSSFLVDAYVTIIIKEINRTLTHFCNINKIETRDDFKKLYVKIKESDIQEMMKLSDSKICLIDKELGKKLKNSILDSYEVQRMDGKGAYVIRKLLRAYISNPQQLPNKYLDRLIKNELALNLSRSDYDKVFEIIQDKIGASYTENVTRWENYECREAMRIIMKDENKLIELVYSSLLRVVFDYVSGMTDSYALKQYNELNFRTCL